MVGSNREVSLHQRMFAYLSVQSVTTNAKVAGGRRCDTMYLQAAPALPTPQRNAT